MSGPVDHYQGPKCREGLLSGCTPGDRPKCRPELRRITSPATDEHVVSNVRLQGDSHSHNTLARPKPTFADGGHLRRSMVDDSCTEQVPA
jgi:hypothetical protein